MCKQLAQGRWNGRKSNPRSVDRKSNALTLHCHATRCTLAKISLQLLAFQAALGLILLASMPPCSAHKKTRSGTDVKQRCLTLCLNSYCRTAVWLSGIEVALRRVRLVLGWVTVRGYTIQIFNRATQAYSAWPSLRGEAH